MSDYEVFVRDMPRKIAEWVLEDLDENGRERSEIGRLVHRMMRDRPWDYWRNVLVNGGEWGSDPSGFVPTGLVPRVYAERDVEWWGGWGPDASGFPGRSEPRVNMDWDAAGRRGDTDA